MSEASLNRRQKAEIETVKEQGMIPIKTLLSGAPFNYDEEIAKEICVDLVEGMELHLNAARATAETDVDMVNTLGKALSSLKDNAVLYCVIDEEAESFDPTTLKLNKDEKAISLFASDDINNPWPAEANFALTDIIKIASYYDLASAVACFMDEVSKPHTDWAGWVANIVVMGFRDRNGIRLKDCPAGILDVPLVLDFVDSFKKRTSKPEDLGKPQRGPYAARVALCHHTVEKGCDIQFGFKQYLDHSTEDIPKDYKHPNTTLIHPDDDSYKAQENETAK